MHAAGGGVSTGNPYPVWQVKQFVALLFKKQVLQIELQVSTLSFKHLFGNIDLAGNAYPGVHFVHFEGS